MLAAGATTVEVYSAFVYRGWGIARELSSQLSRELDRQGASSPQVLAATPTEVA
jgi:dihydroorotate dehydrogenase